MAGFFIIVCFDFHFFFRFLLLRGGMRTHEARLGWNEQGEVGGRESWSRYIVLKKHCMEKISKYKDIGRE